MIMSVLRRISLGAAEWSAGFLTPYRSTGQVGDHAGMLEAGPLMTGGGDDGQRGAIGIAAPRALLVSALVVGAVVTASPALAAEGAGSGMTAEGISAFAQSLLILLREGAEAILILAALWIALRALTAPASAFRSLAAGAIFGLAMSVAAGLAIVAFSRHMDETAELLEGLALVLAAIVLLFVSSWLLGQREAAEWKRRMQEQVAQALSARRLIGLFAVGFLVIFREGAETVLFLYALAASTDAQIPAMAAGGITALAMLAGAFFAVRRLGLRLPLKAFFTWTAWGLFILAIVYAGKGVHELQEYGLLGETALNGLPRLPVIGFYPYLETVIAQGAVLIIGLLLNLRATKAQPRPQAAE